MKFVRFCDSTKKEAFGVLESDIIRQIVGDPYKTIVFSDTNYQLSDVKLLAPVSPQKIIAIGLNYLSHAVEFGMEIPNDPLFFFKPLSSIQNPFEVIVIPYQSKQVEYEAELAVVIKKTCKDVPIDDIGEYIFGYTCLNDITARDLQRIESQWARSKGFDTFCPIGPWIETEYVWKNKRIQTILNGIIKQDANTYDFIFPVEKLISYISSIMTLFPGDVISTGTSGGTGAIQQGDVIQVVIEGIGTLENVAVNK